MSQEPPKKSRRPRLVLGAIAVTIALCACIAISIIGSAILNPTPDKQAIQAVEPTKAPMPTVTPRPAVTAIPTTTPAPTTTPMPTASPAPAGPKYVRLLGRAYAGVKVYYGDGPEKAYAFEILGGSEDCPMLPSGRGLRVRYPDGTVEWKDREAIVASLYVLDNDPAIKAAGWEVFECQ